MDARLSASRPKLDPRSVLRSIIYVQAAIRRHILQIVLRPPAIPTPPIAVASHFSRRLVRGIDENEAMAIAAIVCGHDRVTLGGLDACYNEYTPVLGAAHPVIGLILERFHEVEMDADEALVKRLRAVEWPSDARATIALCVADFEAPRLRPGGGPLDIIFDEAWQRVKDMQTQAEITLFDRLNGCQTQRSFQQLSGSIEREFPELPTSLRQRLRDKRKRHRTVLLDEVQAKFGWPPDGPLPLLAHAARWYVGELGTEDLVVSDFVTCVQRSQKRHEAKAKEELGPARTSILECKKRMETDPPPPKLMLDDFKEQIKEQLTASMDVLTRWRERLGYDSPVFVQFMEDMLGRTTFARRCEAEVNEAAEELREMGPRPPAGEEGSSEEQNRAELLATMLMLLRDLGGESAQALAVETEFASELDIVRPLMSCLTQDDEDEGDWGQPPGFDHVEQAPNAPQRPTREKAPVLEPVEPPAVPSVGVHLKLHGISHEDVSHHDELDLLDKLAEVIATECGVPRECVANITFPKLEQFLSASAAQPREA